MLVPHLFCSSSLASSSSSSGLRLSESAGEPAGADSAASWEEESGLSRGLPVEGGEGRSLSGLPLGVDMVAEGVEPVEELGVWSEGPYWPASFTPGKEEKHVKDIDPKDILII